MLHGDEVWCQLFSEPAAGSDLAAVQTRARQNDDGTWTLNGQKVWTTNAQFASFGLLLARTDADVPKHKGLTMFIVPMNAKGVTVRGLRQISGEAEFNEVFFDDVVARRGRGRRRRRQRLGDRADGADVRAADDRLRLGGLRLAGQAGRDDRRPTRSPAHDPEVRERLGDIITELLAVRFNGYRALTVLARGQIPGPEAGLAKVTMVNAAIAATDLGADVVGPDALEADSEWSYLISFLPGPQVRRRDRADPAQHDRRARARAAARAAARQGRAVQRAARQGEGGGGPMNFALSDEQVLLREAARGSLSRFKTIEAAREALEDPAALPDLWPIAVEAGWPGLLIDEEHGGAGLGAFDALLVAEECGRVLASVPLLGLLPATRSSTPPATSRCPQMAPPASCGPAYVPARPPERARAALDGRAHARAWRARGAPTRDGRRRRGDARRRRWPSSPMPRAPTCWWRSASTERRLAGGGGGRRADADGVARRGRDALRRDPLARPRLVLRGARGRLLDVGADALADAWYLAQALIAAESLGAVQTCLEVSVAYAKERFTFGRAIGSYQAIKHELTEVLRQQENARGLQYYAGWAREAKPDEFPLAASAARSAAGQRARLRGSIDDQRARRYRRDVGARRAAVLPPRAALAAAARRAPTTPPIGWRSRRWRRRGVAARPAVLTAGPSANSRRTSWLSFNSSKLKRSGNSGWSAGARPPRTYIPGIRALAHGLGE